METVENNNALRRLVEAYGTIYRESSARERAVLAKTLGDALAGVAHDWGRRWVTDTDEAVELFLAMGWSIGEPGGVVFARRPAWLDDGLFAALDEEAERMRATATFGVANFANDVDEVGVAFLRRRDMLQWVLRETGIVGSALRPDVSVSYIYYEPGERCPLHLDDPRTAELIMLVCLEHRRDPSLPYGSLLEVRTPSGMQAYLLEPGDVLLFRGDRLAHGRTPLAEGEHIKLFAAGFKVREESAT